MRFRRTRALLSRMGRAGRVWVWALLFVSVGVNLGFLWVTPIIPDRPICFGERSFSLISLLTGFSEIDGDLTDDFHEFWDSKQYGTRRHVPRHGRVLIRVGDWLDWDDRYHATFKAVNELMKARENIDPLKSSDEISVPGFKSNGVVNCQGLRDIAIIGGKWEYGGPRPVTRRESGSGGK